MPGLTLNNLDKYISELPSLSTIVTRLLSLLQRQDITMAALTTELNKDQALTARILRIANSPFYGFPSHISSLQHASTLLGLHTMHSIITAAGIISHFPPAKDEGFDRLTFWQHAIGTGIAAQVLSKPSGFDADQAFTAGLLHDIGKLVLAAHFEEDFSRVMAYRDEHQCLLRKAEQAVLGFDHTEIGARIAQQWKLPNVLVAAIRFHHVLPGAVTPLAELIHVADILVRGLDIGHGGDDLIPTLHPDALPRLGLEWQNIRSALPEIKRLNSSANILLD